MSDVIEEEFEELDTWCRHFDRMYAALSLVGWCDVLDGPECRRVRAEALAVGMPIGDELAKFIHGAANAGPWPE